ncbi:5'-methylthioadenosine/S-adenosylhomocysteine nucleosidase [Vibrio kanaloae]|uniref:phosphorylase family protein n=1 Tax=Vibrio kanaloae TaxID=170673 RepID=UPI0010BF1C71|nr:response regulator [Vibrio kanaloae]TKF78415.1 5'-methylthioadenosine/S-adenosylhomocysteine nucleosidase [Vibrio kanaloae]
MNILVVEDGQEKLKVILETIESTNSSISTTTCTNVIDFVGHISSKNFDLIVIDLLLPTHSKVEAQDTSSLIVEKLRDYDSHNVHTPVIALTAFSEVAEENFKLLNLHNINVITYSQDGDEWKPAFINKIVDCTPKIKYDFVIICALPQEASAFVEAGYTSENIHANQGLSCREIHIGANKGVIVVPPRMGLLNAAIVSARSLDIFEPRIICMSGICAGIEDKAAIYDIVIPSQCDQHDAGKWTNEGFVPESYSVPLEHGTQIELENIISRTDFVDSISNGLVLNRSEMVGESGHLDVNIYTAPTSSGSSVIADDSILEAITTQHRKKTAFEMESYALYEVARQSELKPKYFSAKAVVDNGNSHKGDDYHRVAALISAKAVHGILRRML